MTRGENNIYIIAEAGVNHNGSLTIAKQLIDVAVEAGADAVKFQTFKAEKVMSRYAPKAEYQTQTTDRQESHLEMVKKLQFGVAEHQELVNYCNEKKIQFLSTPFDLESVGLLAEVLDVPALKIPSGEITNAPLILKVASHKKPIILSTGMSTLGEIEVALGVIAFGYLRTDERPSLELFRECFATDEGQALLKKNVTLLHCTTEYPSPYPSVNLKAMHTLREAFGLPVGLSDHTVGVHIPVAAVAMGAIMIEKHFTMDKTLPGPDHRASLEPCELADMVRMIRDTEAAMGSGLKLPAYAEKKNMIIARKSLVADKAIKQGEVFTETNLTVKRPGNGISPLSFWDYLGQRAAKDYNEDELI